MNEVRSPKKPLIFYYIVAMLLVMMFNFIAMPWLSQYQIKEVDYNTFVTMTQQGEIGKVEIQAADNRILFTVPWSVFVMAEPKSTTSCVTRPSFPLSAGFVSFSRSISAPAFPQ